MCARVRSVRRSLSSRVRRTRTCKCIRYACDTHMRAWTRAMKCRRSSPEIPVSSHDTHEKRHFGAHNMVHTYTHARDEKHATHQTRRTCTRTYPCARFLPFFRSLCLSFLSLSFFTYIHIRLLRFTLANFFSLSPFSSTVQHRAMLSRVHIRIKRNMQIRHRTCIRMCTLV